MWSLGPHKVIHAYSYSVKGLYHGIGISLSTRVTAQNKKRQKSLPSEECTFSFCSYIYGPQHLTELEIVLLKCIPYFAAIKNEYL